MNSRNSISNKVALVRYKLFHHERRHQIISRMYLVFTVTLRLNTQMSSFPKMYALYFNLQSFGHYLPSMSTTYQLMNWMMRMNVVSKAETLVASVVNGVRWLSQGDWLHRSTASLVKATLTPKVTTIL